MRGGQHKRQPVRVKLLLVIRVAPAGKTVARVDSYVLSGHTFRYTLAPGQYSISARLLPPVVNPGRDCISPPSVRVPSAKRLDARVRCVLLG